MKYSVIQWGLVAGALGVGTFLLPVPLAAQETVVLEPFIPDDGKPVRRAEPVVRPEPVVRQPFRPERETPEQPEIRVAEPVVPVASPPPVQNPNAPVKPGKVATKPAVAAEPKTAPLGQAELADPTGEIRITPQGTTRPDQMQLNIADRLYLQKSYSQAALEYERYLSIYQGGPDQVTVLYRLAECYRSTGALNAAKTNYENVLDSAPGGELVGPASYRLAELYYQEKNYTSALPLYRRAAVRLKEAKLTNSAKFFTGRCLEALGQKIDARAAYEDVLSSPSDNPFYDASKLSLAFLFKEGGRTAEALRQIQSLAKQSPNEEIRAQSLVYSGLWQIELEQPARAAEDLKKALQMPAVGRWRDLAQLGLVQLFYNEKKFQQVIDTYKAGDFNGEVRPQVLNLVAMSQRQLGKTTEAIALFDQIIKEAPTSPAAKDAVFERLVCLYTSAAPGLVAEVDQFIAANPDSPKHDQALLMKAECLFKKQDFEAAGTIYATMENSKTLNAVLKAEALSKLGWCLMQGKNYGLAIKAYSTLILNHPLSKAVPSALCQRGLAKLRVKDLSGAIKDFEDLNSKFPKAKERELALQQKALTQGQMNENAAMAETFKRLLKEFPETPAAAEANYWIGWVAYENKDYKSAPEPLGNARKLDKEQYLERASLRILLSYFYLENKTAVAREIDFYQKEVKRPVPYEVIHWLGQSYFEAASSGGATNGANGANGRAANYAQAAKFLAMAAGREEAKADDYLNLGRSALGLSDFKTAVGALESYLKVSKDLGARCTGLMALGQAQIGLKDFSGAQKSADAAIALQPDGEFNAKARVLVGDIQKARGNSAEAAKVYESVGVMIDDENITPQALEKAIEAYKESGKEPDAKRLLNTLQSRYPEYFQRKTASAKG